MSTKFEKLMNKKFKEDVKHIIDKPDSIKGHPLSVQAYYKANQG